jgi:hypothetical protein
MYYCPKCNSTENIEVVAQVWMHLIQDDPDNIQTVESRYDGSHEWYENSAASCLNCRWVGWVSELHITTDTTR